MKILRHAVGIGGLVVAGCSNGVPQDSLDGVSSTVEPASDSAVVSFEWNAVYEEGITFAQFLESTEQRREIWLSNYERATVPFDVLDRTRAIPGEWRLLVVAEDWCGDSAHTIPYLARLVDEVSGLEMRVVNSETGAAITDAHRTPDDRGATPTVVILDAQGRDVGCWVERPAALQDWFLEEDDRSRERLDRKYAWYNWDVGESTVAEVANVIAAAAAGTPVCR